MGTRTRVLIGMALGLVWSVGLVVGVQLAGGGFMPPMLAVPGAMVAPGLVMLAMIARLAQWRFFDDALIDGAAPPPGSAAEIDQRVLTNTVEQIVLALAVWPFVAATLGGRVVLYMGIGFALARLAFWIGYHLSPPLRAFGFAATFYPTVLAALWSVGAWIG